MDRTQLSRELLKMIECEIGESLCHLDESADLRSDLNLDSLHMVGLVLRLEQRLSVEITSAEIVALIKVRDLLDLVVSKLNAEVPLVA